MNIRKTSLGIYLSVISIAFILSPLIVNMIGGVRTIIFLFVCGLITARYQQGDWPFLEAVGRGLEGERQGVLFWG